MGKQGTPQQRREREAAALRANLLRRKVQSREREVPDDDFVKPTTDDEKLPQ
ncbi:hypothetical protein WCLP8_2530002 [uncultured Gammaproteobacteria bacterium]